MSNCCGNNSRDIQLKVEGMSCGHCKAAIEKALNVDGVKDVKVNLEEGLVKVLFDPGLIEEDQIKSIITEEGYAVT